MSAYSLTLRRSRISSIFLRTGRPAGPSLHRQSRDTEKSGAMLTMTLQMC